MHGSYAVTIHFKTTDPEYPPVTFCFLYRVVFNLRKCLKSSNITYTMVPITEKYLHSVKEQGRRDKIFLGISYMKGPKDAII